MIFERSKAYERQEADQEGEIGGRPKRKYRLL